MGKAKKKITNWAEYNKALCKRGSVTFWIDDTAIDAWQCKTHHGKRGRGFQYSDTAIETALMLKGIFSLPLRTLQGFIDSIFELLDVPLTSPDYTCISKRSKTVQIKYRNKSRGALRLLDFLAVNIKCSVDGLAVNVIHPTLWIPKNTAHAFSRLLDSIAQTVDFSHSMSRL